MPRLREVPRSELHDSAEPLYQMLFGDRDPTREPGTGTGTPGNWWSVFALVPDVVAGSGSAASAEAEALARSARPDVVAALQQLSVKQRTAVVLKHWLRLTEGEIAEDELAMRRADQDRPRYAFRSYGPQTRREFFEFLRQRDGVPG